ncbi:MAG: hypothetical protein AAF442_04840 [Pseudomonadota bacterium]
MRSRLNQEEAHEILAPYIPDMAKAPHLGLDRYNSSVEPGARAEHRPSTSANSIYDHTWAELIEKLGEKVGLHFLEINGLKILNFDDKLVLRLKKVDQQGQHSNISTKQQKAFDAQESIPGLPFERLILGYEPDQVFSRVIRVTIRPVHREWAVQIHDRQEDNWEIVSQQFLLRA